MTPAQFERAVKDHYHSLTPLFLALNASKQPDSYVNMPQVYEFPEIVGPNYSAVTSKAVPEADARAIVDEVKMTILIAAKPRCRSCRRWRQRPTQHLPRRPTRKPMRM